MQLRLNTTATAIDVQARRITVRQPNGVQDWVAYDTLHPKIALIVGAGYVGLEMAEGLTARGLHVTQVEMLPEVLPTVDPEPGTRAR
jgi:pyruvate/2-oxoglutarate dehydrogenase complex dihydrolipoamide dehydrogenase (E3) component